MIWLQHNTSSQSRADIRLARVTGSIALAVAVLLGLVLMLLIKESWSVLNSGGLPRFFGDKGWFPSSGQFNLVSMLWATLAASIGALFIAVPLGVLKCGVQPFLCTCLDAYAFASHYGVAGRHSISGIWIMGANSAGAIDCTLGAARCQLAHCDIDPRAHDFAYCGAYQ